MKEDNLYEQLAQYMSLKHPKLNGLWHFDLAGVNNPSRKTRGLYSRLNTRGWPDFFLAKTALMPGTMIAYTGLFLELKRDGTRIKKKTGEWASDHIAEQAETLKRLQDEGYVAMFAVGFDEAVLMIESYLQSNLITQPESGYRGRDWSGQDDLWPEGSF